jgi:hypothetical protein
MRSRQELQKDGAVDGQVTANADGPECSEDANSSEIWTGGCDHAEHSSDADGQVESPASTEDVTAKTPEDGAEQ